MEDMTSIQIIHGMQYAGVFDGHGGTEVASECLKMGAKVRDLLDAGYTSHALALEQGIRSVEANHAYIGSTATVALVSDDMITVANVGDSMAYLLRGQKTIALTEAHKPSNESERARVLGLGGHITKGRVQGVLAMTRALGDCALRPFVSCDPEVREIARSHEDRALVLATDGLWDVLSPLEVMAVVERVLLSNHCANADADERASACASLLVSLALERQTMDNVSVVVLTFGGASPSAARSF
jgi:serine/threonine protein phosphatase PrpC